VDALIKTKLDSFERQFSSLAKDFKEHLLNSKKLENAFLVLSKEFRKHLNKH